MDLNNRLYHQQYSYVDPEWYDSFAFYQPTDELLQVVRAVIPIDWRLWRNNNWFYMYPPEVKLPTNGWKIHVSALPDNCDEILRRTATVCLEKKVAFKFALDRRLVFFSAGKRWSREASGKFITIYPLHDQQFRETLDALYTVLRDFSGPYVLSDKRYKDVSTIYYRYGGLDGLRVLSVSGDRQFMLVSPDGDYYPDVRTPFWNPPPWVSDPLGIDETIDDDETELSLKDGRYIIDQALGFSVTGGVYLATDRDTGGSVVIKEARPNTEVDETTRNAVDRLQKEYRLLQKLEGTGITPRPIDLFWDWEHVFLVEEYIPGLDLGRFTIGFNPLMKIKVDEEAIKAYVEKLQKIWTQLARGIASMHEKRIICGDLSIKNVIVKSAELGDIRIIDLEGAWEENVDAPSLLLTPGFASPTRWKGIPSKEDDVYSLGSLMLGTLFPVNNLFDLEPSAKKIFVEAMGGDLGLPKPVQNLIERCMHPDAAKRPGLQQILEGLQTLHAQTTSITERSPLSQEALCEMTKDIADYIVKSANLTREDRLFPADPFVFFTNPLSIAYGATGVLYALLRLTGEVPKPLLAACLAYPVTAKDYAPGLYIGLSGIAWVFTELGLTDVALQIMQAANNHPLLWDAADIFYGSSGYGLTCLRLYLTTNDRAWLDRAVQVGEWLLNTKTEVDKQGYCWPDKEGHIWLGYARGSSGIALYLLYLSITTGDERFLEAGRKALSFDLIHLHSTEEGHLSVPRGEVNALENVLTHYWLDGSAGVVTTLVRYWAYTKDTEYQDVLKLLTVDTFRERTVFPSLFRGLSGLGNVLLDVYDFTGEEQYLHEAQKVASGVNLFKIQRPAGVAFPGEQLFRISTDFATGSAGIGLFLHRLAYADHHLGNFNFTLDQLLNKHEQQ